MPCCATAQACRRCLAGLALASSSRNMSEAQEARPGRLPVWSFTGTTSMLADMLRQTECPHSSLSHLGTCRFFRRMESIRSIPYSIRDTHYP